MKKYFLYSMSAFYVLAGINHFISPEFYMEMMPDYLPFHEFLNITSGFTEVLLGLLLLDGYVRKFACYGIIVLLLAVFPANIHMLQEALEGTNQDFPLWALILRLPIQFLFIYWAWAVRDFQSKSIVELGK
jgi:uncharacterized membrane protein